MPETLSHYRVLSRLGAGGMGEVLLAEDTRLGRKVAVKLLAERWASDAAARRRFLREARAAACLDHPNICAIYEVGSDGDRDFIVMPYLEGETLADRLRRAALELPEVLSLGVQVADALAEAHAHQIVHRDVKPQNILITPRGQAKVLDFGLAKVVPAASAASAADGEAETLSLLSRPGALLGTVAYMSPEQARGEALDERSDIFSFGVVLYEMASGRHPFAARSTAETLSAILTREPPALAGRAGELPEQLAWIVGKALRKDRDERYQTLKGLLADLRGLAREAALESAGRSAGTGATARPAPPDRRTERRRRTAEGRGEGGIDSLAVLPLVNATADPATEYLSDGITESIINNLAQLAELRVVPRSTVFRYKGRDDPRAIADELGVRAVVTGRVLALGERLQIGVELVDVRADAQLWGEHYNQELADLFTVQEDIARRIFGSLRGRLTGEQQRRLNRRHTDKTTAYQHYLKGRYFLEKRTAGGFAKARQHFDRASAEDPRYALAYTGLADTLTLVERYGLAPPREVMPRAIAAARRALELDPTLAEAHASLGLGRAYYEWDWEGSEREFRRAAELNPGYPSAHHWFGFILGQTGRFDEALAEMRRALELDPLSLIINANLGTVHYFARRWEPAIEQLERTLDLASDFAVAHQWLGRACLAAGRVDDAVAAFRAAVALLGDDPESLASLGHAQAVAGRAAEARGQLAAVDALRERRHVPAYWTALLHAGLGETDAAFADLDRACEERFDWLVSLGVEPAFDSLRSDPRFGTLLERIGL